MDNEHIENLDEDQILQLYSDIIQGGDYLSECHVRPYYQCEYMYGKQMQCIDNCSGSHTVSTTCNYTGRMCK